MAKKKAEADAAPGGAERVNKTEAVKRALLAGMDGPLEGVAYVKKEFGLDITPQMFSSYKSLAKKRAGTPGDGRARAGSSSSPADLARTIKALVEQHGADAVIEMAKVFE